MGGCLMLYHLFLSILLFFISLCGLVVVLFMWHKSITDFRIDD
jgi:hypothetical protein